MPVRLVHTTGKSTGVTCYASQYWGVMCWTGNAITPLDTERDQRTR